MLSAIGTAFVDGAGRPLQNIRIRHTHVLDDPFPDPPGLDSHIPEASPEPEFEHVSLQDAIAGPVKQTCTPFVHVQSRCSRC